jgi:hypothetical protein
VRAKEATMVLKIDPKALKLGERVRDTITGFRGVVIARAEHLHDTPSVRVAPQGLSGNGHPIDPCWFSESRMELDPEPPPLRPSTR